MPDQILRRDDLEFLLYDVLDTAALFGRQRYADFSREAVTAILDTAERLAADHFAPFNRKGDDHEPSFDGEKVTLLTEVKAAWDALAGAGLLAAHHDHERGGMQLPEVVLRAAMAHFFAANIAFAGYPFLTIGAANLIESFASDDLKKRFLPGMLDGRFSGTMALTEPAQGSALADIRTTAIPQPDGTYRLKGQKMFISAGDHDLTENIVHMVLARIQGAPPGVKGISLFICPKYVVNDDGSPGRRNDVALAGLLHKMGYRHTTSTVLNFGEQDACEAYLVGEPHQGLGYMFQMMNEARIGVALGAAALGYAGYLHSLDYAKERPQGRLPSNKDPLSPQVPIIEHADVRRMLLMQKVYAEGALALCLYASRLVDDQKTAEHDADRRHARMLLDFLTPVVKTWCSEYCVKANDLAIQTMGGAGYIRENPVEQYYRDNRLNPIHEGTTGIQALDLLGRKVMMNNGEMLQVFLEELDGSIAAAHADPMLAPMGDALRTARDRLAEVTACLRREIAADSVRGLANATIYLDFVGRIVAAWIWLKQAAAAARLLEQGAANTHFLQGKIQAARFAFDWDLPQIEWQARLLESINPACLDMRADWF